jgi:nucleoside-diphosphate kinase
MKSFHFLTLLAALALQTGLMAQTANSQGSTSPKPSTQSSSSSITNNVKKDPYAAPTPDELRSNQKIERTLSILKPDALRNRHIGDIISRFEDAGLRIAAIRMIKLTPEQAAEFYKVHNARAFYPDLIKTMTAGPIVVMVLEGDQAITKNRQIMGETDPKKAIAGTIRADYAESISDNTVHGSDSPETARQEIEFFFKPNEIYAGY